MDPKQIGEELGRLLATSALPDAQKASWAQLIPHMRLDQLLRFADEVLTPAVEQAVTKELGGLMVQIRATQNKFVAAQAELDASFAQDMGALVNEVRDLERAAQQS